MKRILLFFSLAISFNINAQLEIPSSVAQRLQDDKSFSTYAREMMRYVRDNQQRSDPGSRDRVFYEKQEKFLARQLWWLEGRQEANGDIANTSRKTFQAFDRYQRENASRIAASAYGVWTAVGPYNMTTSTNSKATGIGRVDRIAFHPSNAAILYAGTPAGGVFKSTNSGDTWTNLHSFMPSLGVSGIVVSWADANDLYVLTGDGDSNIGDNGFVQGFDYIRPSIGVLKSTDGGDTWQLTGEFPGVTGFYVGYKLVQDPTDANTLIAATSQGMFRTTNGGASWALVSPNSNRYYDIEWKPGSSTRVYAATSNTFYISTDGGATFDPQNDNFDIAIGSSDRIAIAVTPANVNYVYVFATDDLGSSGDNKGVYRSTNSGDTFIQRDNSDSYVTGSPAYMHNITVASDNVNIVIVGELEIWRSTDGGLSFNLANQRSDATQTDYAHDDIHELIYNPVDDVFYVGSDGGVYRSTDDGVSYVAKYSGMNATQYYHFDVSTLDEDYMYGGAQDNGGHLRTASSTFLNTIKGDGYDVRFTNNATSPIYISVNQRLFKSNVGVTAFTQMVGPPDDWYKTVAMVYSNSDIVFTSSDPVYRTVDGGDNWSNRGANGRWAMITCPSNSNRVYAAGGDSWNDGGTQLGKQLFRSDNQGDTWTSVENNPGFPVTITKITGLAVDPGNSLNVWATMGGFTDGEKVYRSTDGGANWTNVTGTLPNLPVNCVTVDANLDVYIGTDVGVFYRGAGMADWHPFFNHLPRVPVTELHIRNGTIYASTFGRGIWRSDTHGDCPAGLGLGGTITGVKFYIAETISTTSTLVGGVGTEVFLRAANYVSMNPGFRANAATGEKFRAWIAGCTAGGIPSFRSGDVDGLATQLRGTQTLQVTRQDTLARIEFDMPFDGSASMVVVDAEDKIKEVLLANNMLKKGRSAIKTSELVLGNNRKLVLVVDGKVLGVIKE